MVFDRGLAAASNDNDLVATCGKRLFNETSAPVAMQLVDSKPAGETFILTYRPAAKD